MTVKPACLRRRWPPVSGGLGAGLTTGMRRDAVVEIVSGLAAGAQVVTAGQLKLRDGAPVDIREQAGTPTVTANPLVTSTLGAPR